VSRATAKKLPADHTVVLVRRLFSERIRPYIGRIFFAFLCMGVAAGTTAMIAYLMEPVLDLIFSEGNIARLYELAALVLVVFVAKGLASYGQIVAMNFLGHRVVADFQKALFRHLLTADLAYFHDNATGTLISRFTNDTQMLRNAVTTALTGMGRDILTVAALVGVMFYQDWLLATVAFFLFPTAVLPIIKIGRRMRKVSTNTQQEMGQFTTLLDETFQGARYVKAYRMEEYEARRAETVIDRLFRLIMKATRTRAISHPIMETLGGCAVVAVMLYGGFQVIGEVKTPGELISFLTALLLSYEPVKRLANLNASLQEGLAAAQRLFAALDVEPSIRDLPGAREPHFRGGAIHFEDVRFAYRSDAPALDGVTLEVPAGKTVALVGPSGAGKSTILNLIPRFYDVQGGRVLIDGEDVRELTLAGLRSNVALVSQETSLFDDTVRANIAYGRLDASEAEICAAARHAGAEAFILALPDGYDTVVGGRGVKLSGGERQRVSIARAMLRNAPILLLDEATSALDSNTERQVQQALGELMRGRTTLVIAHRLSTIADADLIYVIEKGAVTEQGSHLELLARKGTYARLYALQLAEEAGDGGAARALA